MSRALTELEIVQNPALGAYALWRFAVGFQSEDGRPGALPLAFLVRSFAGLEAIISGRSAAARIGLRTMSQPRSPCKNSF
jgi:hypothetical protein